MANLGRPTSAASMLAGLGASPSAKERILVILKNLAGDLPVAEACRKLRLGPTRLRNLRRAFLSAALRACEPRRCGRPPKSAPAAPDLIQKLEAEVAILQESLEQARIREELALLFPWAGRRQKRGHPGRLRSSARGRHKSPVA